MTPLYNILPIVFTVRSLTTVFVSINFTLALSSVPSTVIVSVPDASFFVNVIPEPEKQLVGLKRVLIMPLLMDNGRVADVTIPLPEPEPPPPPSALIRSLTSSNNLVLLFNR